MSRIDEIRARINERLALYPNDAEFLLAEIDQLTAELDKANKRAGKAIIGGLYCPDCPFRYPAAALVRIVPEVE